MKKYCAEKRNAEYENHRGVMMKEKGTSFVGQPFLESRVLMALPHPVGLGLILPIHILIAVSPLGDLSFRKKMF